MIALKYNLFFKDPLCSSRYAHKVTRLALVVSYGTILREPFFDDFVYPRVHTGYMNQRALVTIGNHSQGIFRKVEGEGIYDFSAYP